MKYTDIGFMSVELDISDLSICSTNDKKSRGVFCHMISSIRILLPKAGGNSESL